MIASAAFWSSWAWAAATAVVGFVFFGLVLRQYLLRGKPHQLAWSAVTLMLVGFLLAGTLDKGARKVQARRKASGG